MIRKNEVSLNFFCNNKMVHRRTTKFPPSIGDEIRLPGPGGRETFFEVLRRVWAYDEPKNPYERLNIEVKLI